MLDRLSVSTSLATIIAVLAKLAILYKDANETWYIDNINQKVLYLILISVFLIFFRGKMMHDDSAFFKDIESDNFKKDPHSKVRIKSGLMIGYISWLFWAPAIYFLQNPPALSGWLLASIGLSTIWLIIDIMTRKSGEDKEAKKRPVWVIANILYAVPLILLMTQTFSPAVLATVLVLILLVDWLISDTLATVFTEKTEG